MLHLLMHCSDSGWQCSFSIEETKYEMALGDCIIYLLASDAVEALVPFKMLLTMIKAGDFPVRRAE